MTAPDPVFVPVEPPDEVPSPADAASPVDRSTPRPESTSHQSSYSWVLAVVILVVIALTAAWQLLGVWTTVGILVGLLVLIGAVSRWRQGHRPDLSRVGWPSWRAPKSPSRPPKMPFTRPKAPPKGAPRDRGGSPKGGSPSRFTFRTRPPAPPGRPPARRPAPPNSPRAPKAPSPSRKRDKSAARKALTWGKALRRWRGIGFWVASPIALPLAGLIQVANWTFRRFPLAEGEVAQPDEPAEEETPKEEEKPPADPVPVPGPPVERPDAAPVSTNARPTSTGAFMSSPAVNAAAEAIREHIGGFVGQNAADFTSFVGGLDEVFDATFEALGSANGRFSDDDPISPAVVDHLEQIRAMVSALAEFAREGAAVFLAAHEEDLKRLDNPRPNETKMDYSQQ